VHRAVGWPDQADPHDELLRAEERARVREALARLPERQGKLLLLRYAGLSYAEVAATLESAPGSVGTLLARAERVPGGLQPDLAERENMFDTRSP
jgi:RNA polymerase sigma factor (sigma-70 family)